MTSSSDIAFSSTPTKISTPSSYMTSALDWSQQSLRILSMINLFWTRKMKWPTCTSFKKEWSELGTIWCLRDFPRNSLSLELSASKILRYVAIMCVLIRNRSLYTLRQAMLRRYLYPRDSSEGKFSKSIPRLPRRLCLGLRTGTWRTSRTFSRNRDWSTWKKSIFRVDTRLSTSKIKDFKMRKSSLPWSKVVLEVSTCSTTNWAAKITSATSAWKSLTPPRVASSPDS